jgi:hypothetical protein
MLAGLVLLVVSVRLSTSNLGLFLVSVALIGGGAGRLFEGTTGIVLAASPPPDRLAMASIAFNQGASPTNTVLGFAILVGPGVSVSGWALWRRRTGRSEAGV